MLYTLAMKMSIVAAILSAATAVPISEQNNGTMCLGSPTFVGAIEEFTSGSIKVLTSNITYVIKEDTLLPPSFTVTSNVKFQSSLGDAKNPIKQLNYRIGGNYLARECYWGDIIILPKATLGFEALQTGGQITIEVSPPENPYKRIVNHGLIRADLKSNGPSKDDMHSIKITPVTRFLNWGTLIISENDKSHQEKWVPINAENELGTYTYDAGGIVNNGEIIISQTSLTILSNIRTVDGGVIHLNSSGQLILMLDYYLADDFDVLSGQEIIFDNSDAAVFFGLSLYNPVEPKKFLAKLTNFGQGNGLVFEDKVSQVKYDNKNGVLFVNFEFEYSLNSSIQIRIGTGYSAAGFSIVDTSSQADLFEHGSVVLYNPPKPQIDGIKSL